MCPFMFEPSASTESCVAARVGARVRACFLGRRAVPSLRAAENAGGKKQVWELEGGRTEEGRACALKTIRVARRADATCNGPLRPGQLTLVSVGRDGTARGVDIERTAETTEYANGVGRVEGRPQEGLTS